MKISVCEEVNLRYFLKDVLANMEYDNCLDAYVLVGTKEDVVLDKDEYEQMKSLSERE